MSADIVLPPCPQCGGRLQIEFKLKAKLVSVAGVSMKLGATEWPYLVCVGMPGVVLERLDEPTLPCGFIEEGRIV
jgi:hypothetical protein